MRKQVGSLLWDKVHPFQVFGANTGVGKTVISSALLKSKSLGKGKPLYIKPVSTGAKSDDDSL